LYLKKVYYVAQIAICNAEILMKYYTEMFDK